MQSPAHEPVTPDQPNRTATRNSRLKLAAASLLLAASTWFALREIKNYAADAGGIRWLPRPLAWLVNPPLLELRPPAPTPRPITEIVPSLPVRLSAGSAAAFKPGDAPAWRHPAILPTQSRPRPGPKTAAGRNPANIPATTDWQTFRLAEAIRWRKPLDAGGNATPIVLSGTIFLTGVDQAESLKLTAYSAKSGERRWQTAIASGRFPSRHGKTSDAASTPCCDGRRIYVAWVNDYTAWLAAFSLAGERVWKTKLGPFAATHGFASSPALSHGLVLLNVDNGQRGFMVAVRADSGEIVWRRKRPASGDGSYSSPIVIEQSNPVDPAQPAAPATIVSGLEAIEYRRLADGELLWQAGGIASVSAITPLIADGICVAGSGFPERVLLALKLDEFDETEIAETASRVVATGPTPKLLWREPKSSEVPYVPSPVVKEGRLYLVHDDGLAHCRDLTTGKVLWKRRVGGNFTASPILIGNTMLCASETGACSLLALKDGEILQQFQLPGGCFATPRLLAYSLLFRTTDELLCVGLPLGN